MPTSHYLQISKIIEVISLLRPQSILDVGIGYGKYGILSREYLEPWTDHPLTRSIRIDGIEAFPAYVGPGQRYYYDQIYFGNALDVLPTIDSYDLILLIDVLEHFSYGDGLRLLELCASKSRHVLIATPFDIDIQEAVFGNEFERHRFQWKKKHFHRFFPGSFFFNYHSLSCLIGPESKSIAAKMRTTHLKLTLRSWFPGSYLFYKKNVRGFFATRRR
jgi:hypothetical protein